MTDEHCNFAVLLWSDHFASFTAMSFHLIYRHFQFLHASPALLNPTPTPSPSTSSLFFCGILWAPLECYHVGLVCVLTEFSGLR